MLVSQRKQPCWQTGLKENVWEYLTTKRCNCSKHFQACGIPYSIVIPVVCSHSDICELYWEIRFRGEMESKVLENPKYISCIVGTMKHEGMQWEQRLLAFLCLCIIRGKYRISGFRLITHKCRQLTRSPCLAVHCSSHSSLWWYHKPVICLPQRHWALECSDGGAALSAVNLAGH